jgi:glutaredoxin
MGLFVGTCGVGCGSEAASPAPTAPGTAAGATTEATAGEVVTPPFSVRGDASGLLLVFFDEEGPHIATSRSAIPAERRAEVRVESLEVDEAGSDPDSVFVADLRSPDEDGNYTVRRMARSDFDARIDAFVAAARDESAAAAVASADVIIYGASWCGACHDAQAFLRARGIPFIERDVEEDPTAAADMRSAAAAAGLHPSGIPVIDFRGRIILGFDRDALEEAIRETAPAGGSAGGITI